MILSVSLVFDIALLAVKYYRSRNAAFVLRFMAFAAIANTVAYYMISGLTATFGSSILFPVTCTLTAKIFVFWLFQQTVESDSCHVVTMSARESYIRHSNGNHTSALSFVCRMF